MPHRLAPPHHHHAMAFVRWPWGRAMLALWALCCALALSSAAQAQDAAALRARHAALTDKLASNPFQRPLVLESSETPNHLQGDIYARLDLPFAQVGPALLGNEQWCNILILHLNVKQCRTGNNPAGPTLGLAIGSKHDQPLGNAYQVDFAFREVARTPDYLQVLLSAEQGPMGTSRYRIVLEVVALDAGRSFMHLAYSYDFGTAARMAMQLYLATIGRSKVGFSVVGRQPDGAPQYLTGTRGVVERNTMRYYLAIEAYLGTLDLPAAQQFERRLAAWFTASERYPVQLHEIELSDYLAQKRDLQPQRQRPGS